MDGDMTRINVSERNGNTGKAASDKWGYVVCCGTVITFIAGIGHVNSFALIYNDFMVETHSTAKSLTTAHGVFAVMLAVGGIILNMLSKKFSLQVGGLIGAFVMILGSMTTIMISNTNQLAITFGALQGIGFGIMVPVCYSTVNLYFVERRTTVMSICKAVQGTVLIFYPHLMKVFLSFYGFRGTLIMICGLSLHTIPGMLIMKPKLKAIRNRISTDIDNVKDELDGQHLMEDIIELNIENNHVDGIKVGETKKKKKIKFLFELLSLHILKDPVYLNICIGQSFVNFSDLTFFILQPMLLFQNGFSTIQVAMTISICAGFDVAGRFLLAVISGLVTVNTRALYYTATLVTLLFRIGWFVILQLKDFVWVAFVTGVLGILRAWLHVSSPLVIASHVSHEDFPGAYALFLLSAGLINLALAPCVGLLKDLYEDYLPAFYGLSLCCIPCLLLWPIEYIHRTK